MPARPISLTVFSIFVMASLGAKAQTPSNMIALRGLMPVSTLFASPEGKAALSANYAITGAIQSGAMKQPTLLPFGLQQQQALKDAFITGGNASELADGLGSRLGAAYQSRAGYTSPKDFTSISAGVAALIAYTNATTASDSNSAKYFFANQTTNGEAPVMESAASLLAAAGGVTDIFGKAYGHPAGSAGADPFGNSRPFQTEPSLTRIAGADYFEAPSDNEAYLRGPIQKLTDSPSYPSGHTTYGYMESVLLAMLVPERFQQQIARGAEYGNDRIILGAHYAMDVLGGRALALHDVAQLLANNPAYVGQTLRGAATITDYGVALATARAELTAALQAACGDTIAVCAKADAGRFSNPAANEALYQATQTYGLPVVHQATAGRVENVATIAPEAGHLLTAAFPWLSLAQADDILTATEGPGGGFLDDGSAFGLYSRLDLYTAARKAADLAPAR